MRSTLIALLAFAADVSASACSQASVQDVILKTPCGCPKKLSRCLSSMTGFERLDKIEGCFTSAGCSEAEAVVGAVYFAHDCHGNLAEAIAPGKMDLKKRADSASTTDTKATTTAKTTATTTSTSPATTSATTTATTDSTTGTTTATSTAVSTTSGTGTTSLVCSVTSLVSTSYCNTDSAGSTSCTQTQATTSSCAPGLLCFTATPDSCMKKDDHLTLSGLIVTCVFAAAIGATILAFVIVGVQGSRKAKREEAQRAMLKGKGDVEAAQFSNNRQPQANPMRSEVDLPLITPGGMRSDQPSYEQQGYAQQGEYFDQAGSGGNSVTPPGAPPKLNLHQGLGALSQQGHETHY